MQTRWVLVIGTLFAQTGCAVMHPVADFTERTAELFTPTTAGYHDATKEKANDFEEVGEMARQIRPVEKDPDPWFRDHLMSEKARSIEHNLGIE